MAGRFPPKSKSVSPKGNESRPPQPNRSTSPPVLALAQVAIRQEPPQQQQQPEATAAASAGSPRARTQQQEAASAPTVSPGHEAAATPAGACAEALLDDDFPDFYLPVRHPTGTFREVPVSLLEISSPHVEGLSLPPPLPARPVQYLRASSSSSARTSPSSPTAAPAPPSPPRQPGVHTHCEFCFGFFNSSVCGIYCQHFSQVRPSDPIHLTRCGRGPNDCGNAPSFGAELSVEVKKSCMEVPRALLMCVTQIERWCRVHKSNAATVYFDSGPQREVDEMTAAINVGRVDQVSVTSYDVHSIGSVVLDYLQNMPNTIIPTELYCAFIDAIKRMNSEAGAANNSLLHDLVRQMPVAHRNALKFIMGHLTRLIRWQHEAGSHVDVERLLTVFSHVLLRPPWPNIGDLATNGYLHRDILRNLLTHDWGELLPPLPPAPETPPEPVVPLDSPSLRPRTPLERLRAAGWYWSGLSRDSAFAMLDGRPDGSFLVRDSSRPDEFTLVIRVGGENKMIRILTDGSRFGFAAPLEFKSVVGLVRWYQSNSLSAYNHTLNTELLHPVTRYNLPEVPCERVPREMERFITYLNTLTRFRRQYQHLHQWYVYMQYDIQPRVPALEAFQKFIQVVEGQIRAYGNLPAESLQEPPLRSQRENLIARRNRLVQLSEALTADIDSQTAHLQHTRAELNAIREEIQLMIERIGRWRMYMADQGIAEAYLNILRVQSETDEGAPSHNIHQMIALHNEDAWLVHGDRQAAENLLRGRPDGTFLIRPKPEEDGAYVLSIVYQGRIGHCRILYTEPHYGFTSDSMHYESLDDLVLHYHFNSLSDHNAELEIRLLYPINLAQDRQNGAEGHQNDDDEETL